MARPGRGRRWPGPWRIALVLLVLGGGAPAACASLVLTGTRLIYPAAARQVRIGVLNVGTQPALMQAWIDAGDAEARPQDIRVPFVLTPPMARIDPGQSQTLGVVFVGPALPADRESVFWLNVLDIPPKPRSEPGRNYIQFAVRTRIKLVYRPADLHGNPEQAMRALRWRETCRAGRCSVEADNPTPYTIAIVELQCLHGRRVLASGLQGTALPFGVARWPVDASARIRSVRYAVINDYGALVHARASLAP
jgi:chaperone protein EcpD